MKTKASTLPSRPLPSLPHLRRAALLDPNRVRSLPWPRCLLALAWGLVLLPFLAFSARAQDTLVSGAEQRGAVNATGQRDTWTFSAQAGQFFLLRLGKIHPDATLQPRIQVLDPDGKQVFADQSSTSVGVAEQVRVSGRHTVVVDSLPNGTGEYRLSLGLGQGTVEPVVPPGDEGGPLPNGAAIRGSILPGDLDVWTFDAKAGEDFLLRLGKTNPVDTFVPRFHVLDPAGRFVTGGLQASSAGTAGKAVVAGRYTVIVDSWGYGDGDYRLGLAQGSVPPVVTPGDEGGPLPNGALVRGSIAPGDLDVWSFAACTGNTLRIASERLSGPADFAPSLSLLDPFGRRIYLGAPGPAPDALRAPTNGVYALLVYGHTTNTSNPSGSYRLHVDGLRLAPRLGLRQSRSGAITLDGAGGTPSTPIRILASPDALLPLGSWPTVLTTRYDDGGSFTLPWVRPESAPFPPYFLRAVSP